MLPPYDTGATLAVVERLCAQLMPQTIISLGDSFHDRAAELRLPEPYAERIRALTSAHDWIWVEGNHDPDPPAHLGGRAEKTVRRGPLSSATSRKGRQARLPGTCTPSRK
jgi:metallophosphoesterase superfamily enzyme